MGTLAAAYRGLWKQAVDELVRRGIMADDRLVQARERALARIRALDAAGLSYDFQTVAIHRPLPALFRPLARRMESLATIAGSPASRVGSWRIRHLTTQHTSWP